jgi:hypothetical protein
MIAARTTSTKVALTRGAIKVGYTKLMSDARFACRAGH